MEIEFAVSRAGHDSNQVYFVSAKDETHVYLVNGSNRTLADPKKKNIRHVQIVRKLPPEVLACVAKEQTDLTIKQAVRCYQKFNNQNQEDL